MNVELTKKFESFLNETGINPGGCALYQDTNGRYYMVTKIKVSNGELFLINNGFVYDYPEIWKDTSPWNLLYTKPN